MKACYQEVICQNVPNLIDLSAVVESSRPWLPDFQFCHWADVTPPQYAGLARLRVESRFPAGSIEIGAATCSAAVGDSGSLLVESRTPKYCLPAGPLQKEVQYLGGLISLSVSSLLWLIGYIPPLSPS